MASSARMGPLRRMRENLRPLEGQRRVFAGRVTLLSVQVSGPPVVGVRTLRTVCLENVRLAGSETILADHCWIRLTATMMKLKLKPGDQITFHGTVMAYYKGGYETKTLDYTLMAPRYVRVVETD